MSWVTEGTKTRRKGRAVGDAGIAGRTASTQKTVKGQNFIFCTGAVDPLSLGAVARRFSSGDRRERM